MTLNDRRYFDETLAKDVFKMTPDEVDTALKSRGFEPDHPASYSMEQIKSACDAYTVYRLLQSPPPSV